MLKPSVEILIFGIKKQVTLPRFGGRGRVTKKLSSMGSGTSICGAGYN